MKQTKQDEHIYGLNITMKQLTFALPDEVEWVPDLCEPSVPHQTNTHVNGVL